MPGSDEETVPGFIRSTFWTGSTSMLGPLPRLRGEWHHTGKEIPGGLSEWLHRLQLCWVQVVTPPRVPLHFSKSER